MGGIWVRLGVPARNEHERYVGRVDFVPRAKRNFASHVIHSFISMRECDVMKQHRRRRAASSAHTDHGIRIHHYFMLTIRSKHT